MIMGRRKLARLRALTRNVRTSTTVALWVCLVTSIALLVASFLVPPKGEISPSVLKAGSLLFAFAALMEAREAIMEGLGVKLTHGSTSVEIKDVDGPEAPEPELPVDEETMEDEL